MARVTNPNFEGIPMNDVRPGAYNDEETMRVLHADQSAVYEELTNKPVPGEPALSVSEVHDHSVEAPIGDPKGALIRIPHAVHYLNARLKPRAVNPAPQHDQRTPFYWCPVYVPPGTDSLVVALVCNEDENAQKRLVRLRLRVYDSSLTELPASPMQFINATVTSSVYLPQGSGEKVIFRPINQTSIDFKAGGVFCFRVDATDGQTLDYWAGNENTIENNIIRTLMIIPLKKKPPTSTYGWTAPNEPTNNIKTPSTYQAVEEDWVDIDRPASSAALTFASRNDSLLYEVLTGRPAGQKADPPAHNGHDHANWDPGSAPARGGVTDLDDVGKDISWNLGTWFYGVLRPPTTQALAGDGFFDEDCIISGPGGAGPVTPNPNNVWEGRCVAPTLTANSGVFNLYGTISQASFRLPAGTDDNLGINPGASKISAAVLCFHEGGPAAQLDVEITIRDKDGNNPGVAAVGTTNLNGRQIITIPNIDCSTAALGDGDVQKIRVRMRKSDDASKCAVYGVTLFYEA